VTGFLLPGDRFGLDEDPSISAEAVTYTTLRCYPRHAVQELAKSNSALSLRLGALTIMKLHRAYQHLVLLSRKTAAERAASFVLEMDQRLGKSNNGAFHWPMGRSDIADYLGMTRETLSRVLTELMQEGSVKLSRRYIALHDRRSLHEQAGRQKIERHCETTERDRPRVELRMSVSRRSGTARTHRSELCHVSGASAQL
jgi:CRP/FNR family transcriptional regulator/CRP/FNR family nitrogen fixation transcriptional regulator